MGRSRGPSKKKSGIRADSDRNRKNAETDNTGSIEQTAHKLPVVSARVESNFKKDRSPAGGEAQGSKTKVTKVKGLNTSPHRVSTSSTAPANDGREGVLPPNLPADGTGGSSSSHSKKVGSILKPDTTSMVVGTGGGSRKGPRSSSPSSGGPPTSGGDALLLDAQTEVTPSSDSHEGGTPPAQQAATGGKKVTWTTTFTSRFPIARSMPQIPQIPTAASMRQSMSETFAMVSTFIQSKRFPTVDGQLPMAGNGMVGGIPSGGMGLGGSSAPHPPCPGDRSGDLQRPITPAKGGAAYHHAREGSELSSAWSDGYDSSRQGGFQSHRHGDRRRSGRPQHGERSGGRSGGRDHSHTPSSRHSSTYRYSSSVDGTPCSQQTARRFSNGYFSGSSNTQPLGSTGELSLPLPHHNSRHRQSHRSSQLHEGREGNNQMRRRRSGGGGGLSSFSRQATDLSNSGGLSARSTLNPTPRYDGGGFSSSSLAPPPPYQFKRSLSDMAPVLAAAAYSIILESKGRNSQYQQLLLGDGKGSNPPSVLGSPVNSVLSPGSPPISPQSPPLVDTTDRCLWCKAAVNVPAETKEQLELHYSSTRSFNSIETPVFDVGDAVAEMQVLQEVGGSQGVAIPKPRSVQNRKELLDKAAIEEGLTDFIVHLSERVRFGEAATKIFASSLVYLRRIVNYAPCDHFVVDERNYKRLFILAVMSATKMYLEEHVRLNVRFAEATDIKLHELNKLEVEFLHLIDFNLILYEADFVDTFEWVESIAAKRNVAQSVCSTACSGTQGVPSAGSSFNTAAHSGGGYYASNYVSPSSTPQTANLDTVRGDALTPTTTGTPNHYGSERDYSNATHVSTMLDDFGVLDLPTPLKKKSKSFLTSAMLQMQQQEVRNACSDSEHSPRQGLGITRCDSVNNNTPSGTGKLFSSKFTDVTPGGPTNSSRHSRGDSSELGGGEMPPIFDSSSDDSCSFFKRSDNRPFTSGWEDDDDHNDRARTGHELEEDSGGMRAVKMSPPRPYGRQSPPLIHPFLTELQPPPSLPLVDTSSTRAQIREAASRERISRPPPGGFGVMYDDSDDEEDDLDEDQGMSMRPMKMSRADACPF